ncbi:MAG: polymer-forming cytoskeletal protein [Lentisphaerae bacterium]|nr:polymer-forming cytoskeletal protein [Lentisphaerota bacterium]
MDTANTQNMTVIGEDVEIVGSVKCSSSIQIDGKLNGDLTCSGKAVIGSGANIKGNLNVDAVSIIGQVNGNVTAKDIVELKASARMNGDVRGKRLVVEDGVTFVGKAEVNPSGAATGRPAPAESKPSAEPEAAAPQGDRDDDKKGGFFGKK